MEMTLIIEILSKISALVIILLVALNVFSIIGHATKHHRLVERVQQHVVSLTSLLRIGIR